MNFDYLQKIYVRYLLKLNGQLCELQRINMTY